MTQLTTNKSELSEFVKLRVGFDKVKDLDIKALKIECSEIIKAAFLYTTPNGQVSPEVSAFQTKELYELLKSKYYTYTLPEVRKAFEMGLNDEFGPFFGLCGKTYNLFLSSYVKLPARGKQWHAYLDEVNSPLLAEKPQGLVDLTTKEALIKRFETYKKSGNIGLVAYVAYDLIKKFKGVSSLISAEQFGEIKKKTRQNYIDSLIILKERSERRQEFNTVEAIETALSNIDKEPGLINIQKSLALKMYFDSIDELKL